jgi:hypothetical protein
MSSEPSSPNALPATTHDEATLVAQVLLEGGLTPAEVEDKLVDRAVDRATAQAIIAEWLANNGDGTDGPRPHFDRMVQPILYLTLVTGVIAMFFLVLFALNR